MRKYRNYRELYYHILKSFYLGEYRKGDRFSTQQELVATYRVAANSIKKVFRLLLDDGFITTDRSFGTHVLFDLDDPTHVAKVPLHRPDPLGNDTETLLVPSRFVAYTIYHGLRLATPEQLAGYTAELEQILTELTDNAVTKFPYMPLLVSICKQMNNRYINDFVDFFHHEFIFVDQKVLADKEVRSRVSTLCVNFYTALRAQVASGDFGKVIEICCDYYESLYRIPDLMVFAVLERNRKVFAQQSLYTQLVHKLFLSVIANDMKQGEMLPTEHELAQQYGVSLITVRKAAAVLKEIGLIDSQRFVGTRLTADWNSKSVQQSLVELLESQHQMAADAIFAEYLMGQALCENLQHDCWSVLADTMQRELDHQWQCAQKYSSPLFMSEVFSAPIVKSVDSPLLSKCFFHVHDDLTKFLAIRLLQMSQSFGDTATVHRRARKAIEALQQGNLDGFAAMVNAAVLLNWEVLRTALDKTLYRCMYSTLSF